MCGNIISHTFDLLNFRNGRSFRELLKILLPPIIFEYFELTKIDKQEEVLYLYLEEQNKHPKEFSSDKLQSKGFFDDNRPGFSYPWASGIPAYKAPQLDE